MSSWFIMIPYPVQHSWTCPFRFLMLVTWLYLLPVRGWRLRFLAILLFSSSHRCWDFVRSERITKFCLEYPQRGLHAASSEQVVIAQCGRRWQLEVARWIPPFGLGCCDRAQQVGWWGCLRARVYSGPRAQDLSYKHWFKKF